MKPKIYLSSPHVGGRERELLLEAFESGWVAPLGPQVDAFEREFAAYLGVEHAVALSSGTAALHLALNLVGVKSGDAVLTSTLTFAATANAIVYTGAHPVFIDSERTGWNMDPRLLLDELESSARRGRLPAAVVVVDLYGHTANYGPIVDACASYGVPLIEDAAEALGARYNGTPAGRAGAIGAFSFNGNKIITTSGGGMLSTSRGDWAEKARFLATQARDPAPHYQHSTIGYNYRLSNILAALGRAQLESLEERVAARRAVHQRYCEALDTVPGIEFLKEPPWSRSTHWLTCILVEPTAFGATREELRRALAEENIEARPVWKPMHLQPVFANCRIRGGAVSEEFFEYGLCLPSSSNLLPSDQQRVVDTILAVHRTRKSSS